MTATTRSADHFALATRPASSFDDLAASLRRWFDQQTHWIAQRRLRAQLATMRESLLLDIGIAEDEIYRVRAKEQFTPRAWAKRRLSAQAFRTA